MGDVTAQASIGGKYFSGGDGFIKNYVLSYMWKNIAMANGSDEHLVLNYLERVLTRGQIAEAQRLAQEWMEKHY